MVREMLGLLGGMLERRLQACLRGGVAAMAAAVFAAVSLGFGTFAAFVWLRALEGRAVAALILCLGYGLLAIAILGIGALRRRGRRVRASAAPPAPALDPVVQALGGTVQDQVALAAALRLGTELSPIELLVLSLARGFIAGRKLRK